MMNNEKLYLSEPGVMSAAGCSLDELWNSVTSGNQSGIKRVKSFTGDEFFAARIDDSRLGKTSAKYDMRIFKIEEGALDQISAQVEAAKEKFGVERIAVCVGSCDNGTEFSVAGHREYFKTGSFPEEYSLEIQGADYPATFVSDKFGLRGPSLAFSTACSSSAVALIKAAQLIKSGVADAVVAGGVDIASDTVLIGFSSLEAVSSEITNPFSKNRHGITLGEAASFFVVSKSPLDETGIELLGYGESCDAHHLTSPDPSGDGAFQAMTEALNRAGLKPEAIDYINLHGTGTKLNDSMEAKAVAKIFGENTVLASTTKPMTGHTLGAAGALEAAICYKAIVSKDGKIPLQVWDGVQDEELPAMNFASNKSEIKEIRVCMSNSYAFGGSNASLILGVK